jgi:hypothetical protein
MLCSRLSPGLSLASPVVRTKGCATKVADAGIVFGPFRAIVLGPDGPLIALDDLWSSIHSAMAHGRGLCSTCRHARDHLDGRKHR